MVLGTYEEAISARTTDKKIQEVAQDGGIVSALFIQALEDGIIEGAIVAGDNEDKWNPEPIVATNADEVIEAAGTKYTMCPNVFVMKEAARQYGLEKIGTVATPCEVAGIRKTQIYPFSTRFVVDKLKLLIGIYCMENFPLAALDTFTEAKLDSSMKEVDKMDIGKGKLWIETKDGTKGLPLKETHGYEQPGCNICSDYVAEFADISTGSVGSPDGWSTVLTRTSPGIEIFKAAVDSGLIETKPMDEVKPGLPLVEKLAKGKKDKAFKEIQRRVGMGLPVPGKY